MKSKMLRFLVGLFAGSFFASAAFAQAGGGGDASNVSGIITNLETGVLLPVLNVIVAISYVAGAGFIVASIFKFKAHKDNPTQVTVGTPIMLLFVGIGLLFFPVLIKAIATTVGINNGAGSVTFSGGSVTGNS